MVETTKKCCKCKKTKDISEFCKDKVTLDGFSYECNGCHREYYENHKKEYSERHKKRYKINSEKSKRYTKEYNLKLKQEVINYYGGKCTCCNETRLDFLALDHINGGGTKQKKQLRSEHKAQNMYAWAKNNNYPKIFQIMCHNCNMSKHINKGKCIHQIERETQIAR